MRCIVAIGGGEVGQPGSLLDTTVIDQEIIKLSGKPSPIVLFVPTASNDKKLYCQKIKEHFETRLHCRVNILNLYTEQSRQKIAARIKEADIVYVGGGNTLRMMMLWRKLGVDTLLAEAYHAGKIMTGLSAGAICWFDRGLSDSRRFVGQNKTWKFINVSGLELQKLTLCPHYSSEVQRQHALERSLKNTKRIAIALDDCAALEIVDNMYRIICASNTAYAYKFFWDKGTYHVKRLEATSSYMPLDNLLNHNQLIY